jgi:hypothetical protein
LVVPNFRPTDTNIHIKEKNAAHDNANVNRNKHCHDCELQGEVDPMAGSSREHPPNCPGIATSQTTMAFIHHSIYTPQANPLKPNHYYMLHGPPASTLENSTFRLLSVFMCFTLFSQ